MAERLNKDIAEIKAGVSGYVGDTSEAQELPEAPEASPETFQEEFDEKQPLEESIQPTISPQPYSSNSLVNLEKIHEIAEAIVNERWQEFLGTVGDLAVWKERTDINILSIKQEVVRMNHRIENLQNAILGKINQYDQDVRDIHTEMKALEKVFEKITEPLVTNIKELGRITKELKNK